MESFNFGAFDTQLPGRIAAIPQEAQKQQTANMLQAMQMQGAMREGQMSQMKIDEMLAERKEIDTFAANLKARGYTQGSKGFFTELASSRNPARMQQGYEGLRRLEEQDQFDAYQQRQSAKRTNALAPSEPGAPVNAMLGTPTLSDLQDETRALSMLKDPRAKDELAFVRDQIKQLTQPRVVAPGGTIVGAGNVPTYTAPAAVPPPRPPNMATDLLIPGPNGTMVPNTALVNVRTNLAREGRAPAQPRPEQPPERVVDPDTGKQILVSREEAISRRMTPANTVEKPMTQAQRVTYAKDKVSDKDIVTGALAVTGELEKLTDELVGNPDKKIAPAPGLNSITGYSALTNPLALPSGDARKALQKLETFRGKIMALGRQLASQEGKLGNMAVQEWKFVSDAVQKIDPAAGNLDDQMRDVVRQSREYARRQQAKYDDTYADDLTAPPQAAPAAAISVTAPNGKTYPFATPAQAAAFKKAAGIP